MTLSYETARNLKDAGWATYCKETVYGHDQDFGGHYLEAPTLSELIEACGEEFHGLYKSEGENLFFAFSPEEKSGVEGETPEEAVANLWIELQNNK